MIAAPLLATNVLQGLAASPHAAGKKVVAGDFLQVMSALKQGVPAVAKVTAKHPEAKSSKDEPKKSALPAAGVEVKPEVKLEVKLDDVPVPVVALAPPESPVVVAPLVLLPLPVPEHSAPAVTKPDVVEPQVQVKTKPAFAAKLTTPVDAPVLPPASTTAPATAPVETRQQSTSQRKPENPAPPPAAAPKPVAPAAVAYKADAPAAPASATPATPAPIPAPPATPEPIAAVPAPAANHAVAAILAMPPSTHDVAPPSIDAAAPAPRPAPVEPPAMVESARLIQTPAGSEMHIGLRSDALGQVSVHAVVHNQSVGATIAVQDHETHELLTRDLPALQSHLQEHNIRLDEIAVIPESLSAGTGLQQQQTGSSPGSSQESQRRQPQPQFRAPDSTPKKEPDAPVWTASDGRLSIRA